MRHRILRGLLIPVALLAGLVLLLAAAELAVRTEPLTVATPAPAGIVDLQADERLFTLFAALNASGYDEENSEQGFSPVRQQVRSALAGRTLPSLRWLRPYLAICQATHVSQCATWILQRGPAPDFARAVDGWWLDLPAFLFLGFDRALANFYREADIRALWQAQQPAYAAEIDRYRDLATPAVDDVLAYLRVAQPPAEGIIVLPNLVDAYWRGYGPQVGANAYVVMGPAFDANVGLIQHEAMHPILNPIIDAHLAVVERNQADRLYAELEPGVGSGYHNWTAMVHESVIRAVQIRLGDPSESERRIRQEEEAGFSLVRVLVGRLADHERGGEPMDSYMPELLAALNDPALLR